MPNRGLNAATHPHPHKALVVGVVVCQGAMAMEAICAVFDPRSVFLTFEDIIRLRDERDQVKRELESLTTKYEALNDRFGTICLILPEEARKHILGEESNSDGKSGKEESVYDKWEAVVVPMLQDVGHGITTTGIRKRIEGQPIEEFVGFQGRTLYRSVSKLVERGVLLRDGDYYMLPGQQKPSVEEGVSLYTVLSKAIVDFLSDKFSPLGGRAIMDGLAGTEIGSTLAEKPTYFYNVLSRMVSEGKIHKDGRAYVLPDPGKASSKGTSSNQLDDDSVFR